LGVGAPALGPCRRALPPSSMRARRYARWILPTRGRPPLSGVGGGRLLPRARAGVWAFTPWRAYVRVHAYTHPQLDPTRVKGQAGLRTARNARSRQHAQVAYCAAGHTARAANSRLGAGRRARPREYARVRGNASMHERGHVRSRTHLSTRAASARSGTCGTGCARRCVCPPASVCASERLCARASDQNLACPRLSAWPRDIGCRPACRPAAYLPTAARLCASMLWRPLLPITFFLGRSRALAHL